MNCKYFATESDCHYLNNKCRKCYVFQRSNTILQSQQQIQLSLHFNQRIKLSLFKGWIWKMQRMSTKKHNIAKQTFKTGYFSFQPENLTVTIQTINVVNATYLIEARQHCRTNCKYRLIFNQRILRLLFKRWIYKRQRMSTT